MTRIWKEKTPPPSQSLAQHNLTHSTHSHTLTLLTHRPEHLAAAQDALGALGRPAKHIERVVDDTRRVEAAARRVDTACAGHLHAPLVGGQVEAGEGERMCVLESVMWEEKDVKRRQSESVAMVHLLVVKLRVGITGDYRDCISSWCRWKSWLNEES
jgi:hypothetical protein